MNYNDISTWLSYFRSKPWAWATGGVLVMYLFLHVAQGLIVFIGGIALGLYMYNTVEKNNSECSDNDGDRDGMNVVRNAWSAVRHVGDSVIGDPYVNNNKENFDNYRRLRKPRGRRWSIGDIGDMVWRPTR